MSGRAGGAAKVVHPGDIGSGFGKGRDTSIMVHPFGPCIIGGKREIAVPKPGQLSQKIAGCPIEVLVRPKGIDTEMAGRLWHQLTQSNSAFRAYGMRVEAALSLYHRQKQRVPGPAIKPGRRNGAIGFVPGGGSDDECENIRARYRAGRDGRLACWGRGCHLLRGSCLDRAS